MATETILIPRIGALIEKRLSNRFVNYRWSLKDFESELACITKIQKSTAFSVVPDVPAQFVFQIMCEKSRFQVDENHYIQKMNCELTLKSVGRIPNNLTVEIKTELLDKKHNQIECEITIHCLSDNNIQLLSFKRSKKMETIDYLLPLPENKALIRCEVEIFESPACKNLASTDCTSYSSDLARDLESVYDNSILSDITVKMGTNCLKSHKVILAARSSVFRMMMEHDCLESNSNVIHISDCDLQTFKTFLKYLYTSDIQDKSLTSLIALYILGDMYNVQSLIKACSETMIIELTSGDVNEISIRVCSILKLAHQQCDNNLKETASRFIVGNFLKVVLHPEWDDLLVSHPQLVSNVLVSLSSTYQIKVSSILILAYQHCNNLKEMATYVIVKNFIKVVLYFGWNNLLVSDPQLASNVLVSLSSTYQKYLSYIV